MPTKEIPNKIYETAGKCLFCLADDQPLTVEHIIPRALCSTGEMYVKDGSCSPCNGRLNEEYENPLLQNEFKLIRAFLDLKRRKKKPLTFPKVLNIKDGFQDAPLEEIPPLVPMLRVPPAGLLAGVVRGSDLPLIGVQILNLGPPNRNWGDVGTQVQFTAGSLAMVMTKIGYAYAAMELGLDRVIGGPAHDLLMHRRDDIYNIAGGLSAPERLSGRHFHHLHLRTRGEWITVIVHLFASFGALPWEVVICTA